MWDNIYFLIGFGATYGAITIISAFLVAQQAFQLVDKYANRVKRMYTLKILGLFFCTLVFFTVFTVISMISSKFPINDDLWKYFSGSGIFTMLIMIFIYSGIKNTHSK